MLNTILVCIAVLAFLAIVLEDVIHLNKAKSTLFLGTLCWILLFTLGPDHQGVETAFSENILDIASLWLFLFAAMTFVAYLNQHGMDAFRFYTKTKTVTSRWPSGVKDGAEFVIPTMK